MGVNSCRMGPRRVAPGTKDSPIGGLIMANRVRIVKVLLAVLGVVACGSPALAGGGEVLPANANPKGFSLKGMAAVTAVYNTGVDAGNPLTPPPPDVPFQILKDDVTVKPGTMLYLPIFHADDSDGAPSGFPANVDDQDACADFLDDFVLGFGVTAFIVQVDGCTTVLDDGFIAGTRTAPLLDGTVSAGTNYIACAAFLTPLTPGKHTVGFGGIIFGETVVIESMEVTVR
jgi:hypothetical protein